MHLPKLSNHTSWMAAFGLGSTLLRTRLFRSVFFKNSQYDKSFSKAVKSKIIRYVLYFYIYPLAIAQNLYSKCKHFQTYMQFLKFLVERYMHLLIMKIFLNLPPPKKKANLLIFPSPGPSIKKGDVRSVVLLRSQ